MDKMSNTGNGSYPHVNLKTTDSMPAGSLLLVGAQVPRDAGVVVKLREAGAVILGKTNMCQWAGFRCQKPSSGWSAHGGQTFAAYLDRQEPTGSSGGSAVAVDLGLAFAALGTETDGSIVWPAQRSGCVGIKPTVGLTSRDMVIPLSENMDSVGTLGRSVYDAALVLQSISGPDDHDKHTRLAPRGLDLVGACKNTGILRGSKLGIPWNTIRAHPDYDRMEAEVNLFREAVKELEAAGAFVIDIEFDSDLDEIRRAQKPVTAADFLSNLAEYLGQLKSNPSGIRTLAELREGTQAHPGEGYPEKNTGHWDDVLEHGWDNTDARFPPALEHLQEVGGPRGLIGALDKNAIAAVVMPTSFAPEWTALIGAPMVTVPMGHYPADQKPVIFDDGIVEIGPGVPVGLSFLGRKWSDAELVGLANAYEHQTKVRQRGVQRYLQPDAELEIKDASTAT